ncbi:MAG TPA: hypothetical protein PKA64_04965 [Myxococcota bacterium]|nr:hypothetical protein [Myxococcota bacterium]
MRPYIVAGDYIEICRNEAPEAEIAAAQHRARAVTGLVPEVRHAATDSEIGEIMGRLAGAEPRISTLEVGSPKVAVLAWKRYPGELGRVDITPAAASPERYQIMLQPVHLDGRALTVQILASGAVAVTDEAAGVRHLGQWDGTKIAGCDLPVEISYHVMLWLVCRVRTKACVCVLDPEDEAVQAWGTLPANTMYVGLLPGKAARLDAIPVTPVAYVGWGDGAQVRLPPVVVTSRWLIERGADETELLLALGCRPATVVDPLSIDGRLLACEPCLGIAALRHRLARHTGPVAACHRCARALYHGDGEGVLKA